MDTVQQTEQTLLEVKNLVVEFEQDGMCKRVVDQVSFSIKRGECLGLVGESGSGKSTIANAIMRFIKVQQGQILFNGRDILALTGEKLRNLYRDIQIIFQNPDEALSPRIQIGEYLTEVYRTFVSADKTVLQNKRKELLEIMGMSEEYAGRYPAFLSGGERQRVSIARAVSALPSLIICDEPTSALDVSVQALIVELLLDLQQKHHLTYLFISHDLPLVSYICQRVIILYRGEIVEILSSKEMKERALHPYTHRLLSSAFTEDRPSAATDGSDMEREEMPGGCVFQHNCPYAVKRCAEEKPGLRNLGQGHYVACFQCFKAVIGTTKTPSGR